MRLGGLSCQLRTDGACKEPSGARALRAVTVFPSSSASVLRLRVGFRWNISSILPFFRVSISTQSPVWYPVSDTLVGRTGSKHSMQLCLHEKRHQYVCHAVVAFEGAHCRLRQGRFDLPRSAHEQRLRFRQGDRGSQQLLKLAINRLKQLHNPSCTTLCRKVN